MHINQKNFVTDVGTGLPYWEAVVSPHKQWDRGPEQSIQVFILELLKKHDHVMIAVHSR